MTKKQIAILLSAASIMAYGASGSAAQAQAQKETVDVTLEQVADGLSAPLIMVQPQNDERRFIVEQGGTIRVLVDDGFLLDEPFLDISHKLPDLMKRFDERGLLGLAFHPNFNENGRFFVYHSGRIPGSSDLGTHLWYSHTNYVAEYRVSKDNPNKADVQTERVLMGIDWPQFNHNGGWLGFGPDGMLYISTGDGGYANDWGIGHNVMIGNGQDGASLHGKVLRINVDVGEGEYYTIPEDNPFVGDDSVEDEIYAMGFRNPWRCSFDMGGDGELFCADVGQNAYEEVNIVTKGGNYGWRVKEASKCFDYQNPNTHPETCEDSGMTDPILEYQNCNVFSDCKGISITGGYVYRGDSADHDGTYFFADWSKRFDVPDGRLYAGVRNGDATWEMRDVVVNGMEFAPYILGFGQDLKGDVYVMVSDALGPVANGDRIYRIKPGS